MPRMMMLLRTRNSVGLALLVLALTGCGGGTRKAAEARLRAAAPEQFAAWEAAREAKAAAATALDTEITAETGSYRARFEAADTAMERTAETGGEVMAALESGDLRRMEAARDRHAAALAAFEAAYEATGPPAVIAVEAAWEAEAAARQRLAEAAPEAWAAYVAAEAGAARPR